MVFKVVGNAGTDTWPEALSVTGTIPMPGSDYSVVQVNQGALGIDVAATEGQINWDVIAAHVPKVVFAGIRATISWGYQDKWFPNNWVGAQNHGILRAAYHVVYPGQPVADQMHNFFAVLELRGYGELPCVLDVELDQGQTKTVITNCIVNMADYIRHNTGRNPIIYSRKAWIDQFTLTGAWRNEFDWWLAQYLDDRTKEDPRSPALPVGVTRWLIHQNADHYPSFGMPQALQMDIDRWNGSEADIYAYANMPPPSSQDWRHAIDQWARTEGYNGPPPEMG